MVSFPSLSQGELNERSFTYHLTTTFRETSALLDTILSPDHDDPRESQNSRPEVVSRFITATALHRCERRIVDPGREK